VLLPDEQAEEEERELIEAAFDMGLVAGDKEAWAGSGLMRMPGLVPERERGWVEWHGGRTAAMANGGGDEEGGRRREGESEMHAGSRKRVLAKCFGSIIILLTCLGTSPDPAPRGPFPNQATNSLIGISHSPLPPSRYFFIPKSLPSLSFRPRFYCAKPLLLRPAFFLSFVAFLFCFVYLKCSRPCVGSCISTHTIHF
jgi:hypothetical protein